MFSRVSSAKHGDSVAWGIRSKQIVNESKWFTA